MTNFNQSSPHVSVIVPVYNGGDAFKLLLHSLQNQTLSNIEMIFVSDSGTDGSFEYVQSLALTDSRIICIQNNDNRGPGVRRNQGIFMATGEYIAFADADDYMELDFYELLYHEAKRTKCKVVKGRRLNVYQDGRVESPNTNSKFCHLLEQGIPPFVVFTYEHQSAIYERAEVSRVHAENAESKQDEDTYFLLSLLFDVKKEEIAFCNSARYYYRKHSESLVGVIDDSFMEYSAITLAKKLDFIASKPYSKYTNQYVVSNIEDRLHTRFNKYILSKNFNKEYAINYVEEIHSCSGDFIKKHRIENMGRRTRRLLEGTDYEEFISYCIHSVEEDASLNSRIDYIEVITSNVKEEVQVCVVSDNGYVVPTIVMLTSLKVNKRKDSRYVIHCLINQIEEFWMDSFIRLDSDDFSIRLYELSDERYRNAGIKNFGHIPPFNYVRFDICTIFENLDKILYLDGDIIVNEDLTDLYATPLGTNYFAGVPDYPGEAERKMNKVMGISHYYNSGVMLMNLKQMRIDDLSNKFMQAKVNGPDFVWHGDQDVFNFVCKSSIIPLHCRYNAMVPMLQKRKISDVNSFYRTEYTNYDAMASQACILHLCGINGKRPWHVVNGAFSSLWMKYFNMSPIKDIDLNRSVNY